MRHISTTSDEFRSQVHKWITANGEVCVLIRFSEAAGNKCVEFFNSMQTFINRIMELPPRTCVIAFGTPQLSLRGRVDQDFIKMAVGQIPENTEFMVAGLDPVAYGKYNWCILDEGENLRELEAALADFYGDRVAVGVYPPWVHDTDDVISAIVPEADGSIRVGVY